MNDFDRNELEWLTGMYLDGMVSRADVARLNYLLAANREAARVFARACRLDSCLTERYRGLACDILPCEDICMVESSSEHGSERWT